MMRLDKWLVHQQHVSSRAKAKDCIELGLVKINQQVCLNCSYMVMQTDHVAIETSSLDQYVSRSAHKLKAALDFFRIKVSGIVALDVGMSTGGFTQVLIENGASKVIGVDVGHDQLHESLKNHPYVEYYEGVNVKEGLPFIQKFPLIVVDVSFISVTKILHVLISALDAQGEILLLIKPQFEQVHDNTRRKMILSDKQSYQIAHQCRDAILKFNIKCSELFEVPLKGKEGNQEFFLKCTHV